MKTRNLLRVLLSCALLLGALACDSSNPVAPTGTVLTVIANPTFIPLNGTAIITVTGFRPDGNPLFPGTQINLTTNLGTLGASTITVGDNGRAQTTLTGSGQQGMAMVTASTPGADAMAEATVQIGEDATTQPTLAIAASPNRISVDGTSVISVIARNADGSFRNGGQVRVRTTLGTLDDTLLITDANGEAQTVLRSDGRAGTADITASVDSGMEVMTMVTILGLLVDVQVSPRIVNVEEEAQITVLVRDEDNLPRETPETVRLTASLGTVDPSVVTTDANGIAMATYIAGTRAGTDTITAFVGNSAPATTTVDVRTAPAGCSLAPPAAIIQDNGASVAFTAIVTDAEGLGISNEIVSFTVTGDVIPSFNPSSVVSTDGTGRASTTITFESGVDTGESYRVTATVRGITCTPSATITVQ